MKVKYPVRILQVVTIMNMGGIEAMLMTLYRNIDRSRIQFDFLVHRQERGIFDDEIESLGGKIFRMPALKLSGLNSYLRKLNAFFAKNKNVYKVVHSHINTNSYLVLNAANANGIPARIAHAHIDSIEGYGIKQFLKKLQKNKVRKVANHYFACSANAGQWLYGKENLDKTVLINNAIDTNIFKYSETKRRSIREQLGLENAIIYGHVGRFNTQKNHLFLLDVFNEIQKRQKDAYLVLIGDGDLRPDIERKIKDLGINAKVKLLGLRRDVPELLSAMDVFLFPSLYEGLSVASVEAQCAGLHIFVSDTISKESFITDHIEAIPLSASPEEWATTIMTNAGRAVDRHSAYKKIIDNGYDIHHNVRFLENFYLSQYEG